mmetsp:Transcript_30112/g.75852  ORF Transcript_30112/g.75852 Transcript_30112/m.75852 type:complete len:244 (-) Transcript_30112:99-830(-)
MGIRDDLRDLLRSRPCLAADEIEKLAEVLLNQVKSWEGRKNDGRDDPSDGGDDDQRHYKCHIGALLRRKGVVDDVRQGEGERWGVVGLPIRHVDVAPSLVLVRHGAAREEVPGDARHSALLHRRCNVLVLEDEEERRCEQAADHLLEGLHGTELQDDLNKLRDQSHQTDRDDPLRMEEGAQGRQLTGAYARQAEVDEEDDVKVDRDVHKEVAHVEGHGGKVKGQGVENADALTKQVVVPRADD